MIASGVLVGGAFRDSGVCIDPDEIRIEWTGFDDRIYAATAKRNKQLTDIGRHAVVEKIIENIVRSSNA